MGDYLNVVQVEEINELVPNKIPESTSSRTNSVSSFDVSGYFVTDTDSIGDNTKEHQNKSSTEEYLRSSQTDETPMNSSKMVSKRLNWFPDRISSIAFAPIKKCVELPHSSQATDMSLPAVLQNKIQSMPRPASKENVSKCNICEYRSSIEQWHFPDGLIFCPKCLHIEAPLLRSRTKKVKRFFECTNFMLYCWPLCFLPYLTRSPPKKYLHCPQCFTFLGMYDERRRCIRPNHEYVEYNGCFSAEETQRREQQQEQEQWREKMFMRQVY